MRRECIRSQKFDTKTTHGLLVEFRGLGVQRTHFTRTTRTRDQNFVHAQNPFWGQTFFRTKDIFRLKMSWGPKFILNPNFLKGPIFFRTEIFFRPAIFFRPKNFLDSNWTSMKDDLWREKRELLSMRLSKLSANWLIWAHTSKQIIFNWNRLDIELNQLGILKISKECSIARFLLATNLRLNAQTAAVSATTCKC